MNYAPPPPYSEKNPYQQGAPPPSMAQPMYVAAPMHFGEYSVQCTCPVCHKQIVSRTEKNAGIFAWMLCGIMFIFALWVCCFIPFCVDICKDTKHYCPSCNTLLGVDKKI